MAEDSIILPVISYASATVAPPTRSQLTIESTAFGITITDPRPGFLIWRWVRNFGRLIIVSGLIMASICWLKCLLSTNDPTFALIGLLIAMLGLILAIAPPIRNQPPKLIIVSSGEIKLPHHPLHNKLARSRIPTHFDISLEWLNLISVQVTYRISVHYGTGFSFCIAPRLSHDEAAWVQHCIQQTFHDEKPNRIDLKKDAGV